MLNDIDEIYNLGFNDNEFILDTKVINCVEKSYSNLINSIENGVEFYGVHTGFGANVTTKVNFLNYKYNQLELLRYLQVGIGKFFSQSIVKRALKLQVIKLSKGFSGIHPDTFKKLLLLANSNHVHEVYEYGSLGASGDLIPMAHAVAPIFENNNNIGPRDVLSLVNTNAMMASYAIELYKRIQNNMEKVFSITALNSFSLLVTKEPFSSIGHSINAAYLPNVQIAGEKIINFRKNIEKYYKLNIENELIQKRVSYNVPLQEKYSIRCSPQVLGNILNQLKIAEQNIYSESLIIADNPLIISSEGENKSWHGGMFYTAALGSSVDMLMDVIGRATELLDRQILILMHPSTSHGLSENLGSENDLHLKGLHQLLSSLQQQIRSLAVPSRLMSFSAESNNQDILPCTMAALHNLKSSIEIFDLILNISHFIAEKALHIRFQLDIPQYLILTKYREYDIPIYN